MKNLFLLAMTLFSLTFFTSDLQAQGHFNEVIGTVKSGKITLTANKENIMKNWSSILRDESKIDTEFTDLEILKIERGYLLIAKSAKYTSKVGLVNDNGNLHILKIDDLTVTCTTEDCSSEKGGCVPLDTYLICTDCSGDGKCKRTITVKFANITENKL